MTDPLLEPILDALRAGGEPPGGRLLKHSRVRVVARVGDLFVKVFRRPGRRPAREARVLQRARDRGLPVPALVGAGPDWVATRWVEGRPASRSDLDAILETAECMHRAGLLHGDFHLGNLIATGNGIVLTDLQRARFLPWIPRVLRSRELGWLAYSLGEPLPDRLAPVRFWCERRARRHLRSRTRRCVLESGGFTRFTPSGTSGFRRRDADVEALSRAFASPERGAVLKEIDGRRLLRVEGWILKQHRRRRDARRAWVNGHGLEVRGIRTGRGVAWAGRWLAMEDAGATVEDFVGRPDRKPDDLRELLEALADVIADLHRRGIYHADLKANNFAWSPGRPPRLLDYGRVRFGRRVSTRRRIKNLAQINAALPDGVPAPLREEALRRYVARSGLTADASGVRRRVIALSLRRAHRWSGC